MGLPVRRNRVATLPACQVTDALGFLRGAWTLNVIWYLRVQARRFGELRHDMTGISARQLSARLKELETHGLVIKRPLASSPPSAEYDLTELGRELLPAIDTLAAVGQKLVGRRNIQSATTAD